MGAVTAAAATRVWGANDQINMGIVGLGGRGGSHMNGFPKLARVVAVCDIDQAARERDAATAWHKLGTGSRPRPDAAVQSETFQLRLGLVLGHRKRRHRKPGRA